MSLRVVSWNILQGGGSRLQGICDSLRELNPDVLVLQEFRHGKHAPLLINTLDELGLVYQVFPESPANKNSVVVASRTTAYLLDWSNTLSGVDISQIDNKLMYAVSIEAVANAENKTGKASCLPFILIAAHLPHKKAQRPYFEALLQDKDKMLAQTMILGDLNCGIPFEDSDTKTFDNTHLFQALLQQGWIDSWRSRHERVREFSWISPRGNGYRYDHCLCSESLDKYISKISYTHSLREEKFSDHSALIIDVE